jgi:hypothetical protein
VICSVQTISQALATAREHFARSLLNWAAIILLRLVCVKGWATVCRDSGSGSCHTIKSGVIGCNIFFHRKGTFVPTLNPSKRFQIISLIIGWCCEFLWTQVTLTI